VDRTGTTFGRYEILRPLGAGGMGEILLARQAGLPGVERRVVLKKVLPHLAQDTDFIKRFLDETRVASSLTHGNIVQVYEAGEADGQVFMAMEYVEGMDLREVLATLRAADRRMPEHLALYVLVEVAKGLAYAHDRVGPDGRPLGIVHRDVSPANLLLAFDGQVKLTDFGVAKAAARLSLSLPGTLHGKVYYMSPEQVSGGECDPRSDVFSLGVVAWEMFAGRRPFEGDSDVAVIDAVRRCEPPPLRETAEWVAPSLAAIVERALRRDPAGRHANMHELQQALTSYMLEAHTLVSARGLADFLAGMRRDAPDRAAAPAAPSVDAMAAMLLGGGTPPVGGGAGGAGDAAPKTRTVAAATPLPSPPAPAPAAAPRTHLPWVAVLAVAAAAVVGIWAAGLPDDGWQPPPGEVAAAGVADTRAAVPDLPATATDAPGTAADVPAPPVAALPLPPLPTPVPVVSVAPAEDPGRLRKSVTVKSDPEGAEVWSGGRRLGVTPLDVPVPPTGTRQVEVRADRYEAKTLTVGARSPAAVVAALERLPTGHVRFRFFPADAEVFIDDRLVTTSGNVVKRELPEGEHVLRVESGDRKRIERFRIQAMETTELGSVEP